MTKEQVFSLAVSAAAEKYQALMMTKTEPGVAFPDVVGSTYLEILSVAADLNIPVT
jgi:hypothetical protein